MAKKRIGELLKANGLVTEEQLNQGLEAQRSNAKRLGVTLVDLGFLTEEQLASTLADALQTPRVDLGQVSVDWGAVHLLKPQLCEARGLFPFALENVGGRKTIVVAMSDPLDVRAIEEIEFTTGLKLSVRVASLSGIRAAILRYYHRVKPPAATPTTRAQQALPPPPPPAAARRRAGGSPPRPSSRATETAESSTPRGDPTVAPEATRTVSDDLAVLFGQGPAAPPDASRRLEVLVRLLIRKGVLTEAEWLAALRGS